MFAFLSENLAIVTLLALTLVVLGLLALVVWAAVTREAQQEPGKAPAMVRLQFDTLKQSFRRAVELIEANIVARPERYNVPWALVLNETESTPDPQTGQPASSLLPLTSSGLSSAMSTDAAMAASALGLEWNFFDTGVVLQLRSEFLADPDQPDERERTWDDLLGLCRAYRPDRPFDALILSVPAEVLLDTSPQGLARITAKARSLHRRLWLAQNRFALRFPVYLVVSGLERIAGFSDFAAGLSEPQRAGILGWSNPHEVSAPYQTAWINAGMDQIVADTARAVAELAAVETVGRDSSAYFLLPSELERIRHGLRCLTDEFMRPSAYHEPFMLRGFYLSGWAQSQVEESAQQAWSQPAFLRDVFERKVFAEAGLVRSSSVQRLRRPALSRALRWSAAAVLAGWGIGLVVATWALEGTVGSLTAAVQRLDRDTLSSLQAQQLNQLNPADSRARAMSALTLISQLDAGALGSVFMPGSWSWFDPLQDRVQQRLELRFSENSWVPIRRALYAQVGELTGTPTDPSTGELIQGAPCSLPSGWQEAVQAARTSAAISVEDAPEFSALLRFMGKAELLDKVVAARVRLVSGREAPSAADLKLVVSVLLGADITVNPERTAELFRKYAKSINQTDRMQQAMTCSFRLAMHELEVRLFEHNELMQLERTVAETAMRLTEVTAGGWDAQQARAGWQDLLDDLRRQEEFFRPGRGHWMQSDTLQFGAAYDSLLQRVESMALLGPQVAASTRVSAQDAHARFRADWNNLVMTDTSLLGGGLAWSDKEGRWGHTEGRASLRAALHALLAMPFMQNLGRRPFPEPSSDRAYTWDAARLEQAAQLYDVRRKVDSEVLAKVSEGIRPELDRLARSMLAEAIVDATAQAMSPSPVRVGSLSEPERAALGRVRVQLVDLGAAPSANRLVSLLAGDAQARLRLLEDAWAAAEPFQPADRGLESWSGDRPPMWDAYGVEDGNALAGYVAQQQGRVLQLARDAEIILMGLDPSATRAGSRSANDDALVRRWRAIVAEAEKYKSKNASSSLLQLEQFLTVTAADVDLANCGDKLLARSPSRRAGDPLAVTHRRLYDDVLQRCRTLKLAELRRLWGTFREAFNREAAGRIPFTAQAEAAAPSSPPAVGMMPVALQPSPGSALLRAPMQSDDVVSMLRQYERISRLLKDKLFDQNGRHPAGAGVLRFGQQLDQVRQFLAPLLTNEEEGQPGFDVAVELRVLPQDEIDGNKFIEWALNVGPQSQSLREPMRPLRWSPGTPVDFTLRAARNSLIQPVTDMRQPSMSVDDGVVRFSFSDLWSLFSMVQTYKDQDRRSTDARAPILRFEFPVNRRESERGASVVGKARVYVRLSVSPAGKRTALAWPANFPNLAPEWGSP